MFNIRLLVMLAATAIAAVCIAYAAGRFQGSAAERRACEAEIHAAELTAERQARESERKAQEAQNAIVEDYEHQIADYRRTVDAYVDADRLSGHARYQRGNCVGFILWADTDSVQCR